jgi:pimeloyl-ACP methyl ester carboxylesterase
MKCNFIIKIIFVFTLFFFLIFLFGSEDEYKPSYLKSSFVEVRNNYFPEEPTNGMQSTVQRGVTLQRQSSKKTDRYYNFYLQSDTITLAMNYDPSLENPMVTKQGGSLKGIVSINNGAGFNGWAGKIEVTKPVSRPWVEWIKDELIDTEEMELTEKESERSEGTLVTGISDYRGPRFVAVNQPRNVTFKYTDSNPYDKNGVFIYPAKLDIIPNTTDVSITPKSLLDGGKIKISLPVEPNVKIEVKGKNESQTETDVIIAVNLPDGRRKFIDTFPISVFDAGLAVDYNRDGIIEFDDPFTHTGNDHIPGNKQFEFWLNDDYDELHPSEDEGVFEQDDLEIRTETVIVDQVPIQVPKPDYKLEKPSCERDLEDYARLHIKAPELSSDVFKDLKYKLYFTAMQEENPQIKVFETAINIDDPLKAHYWGEEYLKDETAAGRQLKSEPISQLPVSKSYASTGLIDLSKAVEIQKSKMPETGKLAPFLFEGVSKGSGKLNLSITDENGVELARYKIPMKLKEITEFYDKWTVGEGEGEEPMSEATLTRSVYQSPPQTEEEKDYILFVHGWNWSPTYRDKMADTMYKRLYWLGYKGRMGTFTWPTTYSGLVGLKFDQGEYRAFQSAHGLVGILRDSLDGYRIHLFAHSQGAAVTGEALRQLSQTGGRRINTYITTQAAIPASAYKPDMAVMPLNPDGTNQVRTRPDLWGQFPKDELPIAHWENYFASVRSVCDRMVNFYNQYDFAVGDPVLRTPENKLPVDIKGVKWLGNMISAPCSDTNYYGGWWRLDQCIKYDLMWRNYTFGDYPCGDNTTSHYCRYFDISLQKAVGDVYQDGPTPIALITEPNPQNPSQLVPPSLDNRYKILAFATQGYSRALGAQDGMDVHNNGPFDFEFDLQSPLFFNVGANKDAVRSIYHAGQFRSFLPKFVSISETGEIITRRSYWDTLLRNLFGTVIKPR